MNPLKLFLNITIITIINMFYNNCQASIFSLYGDLAIQEYSILFKSFVAMLIIVIPVIIMTFFFVLKYSAKTSNIHQYCPNWSTSNIIEILVWGIPILIILFLASMAWKSTHTLDSKRNIPNVLYYDPIEVDVVALDWKWLFIYPNMHVATINKLVLPVNRPVNFKITSYSVMNSFFIPLLGSQIYAMPGMCTHLHLIANKIGVLKGISSNFSGKGFSNMNFLTVIVNTDESFKNWIRLVSKSSNKLDTAKKIINITKLDETYQVKYFSAVVPCLFDKIVKQLY